MGEEECRMTTERQRQMKIFFDDIRKKKFSFLFLKTSLIKSLMKNETYYCKLNESTKVV